VAVQILGIVNITEDSFSDGARYLAPDAAIAHGRALVQAGADVLDIGAAASNPRAARVPPQLEIERLSPVVQTLKDEGIPISVDTFARETQLWASGQGVPFLNDINGFPDPVLYPALAASRARLIVMHALRAGGASSDDAAPPDIFDRVLRFFEERIAALGEAGIARDRLILDPGMGLFLGRGRGASFTVLRRLADLKRAFGLPVLVSVSRKSFLRAITGRAPADAGPTSLAAELFAVRRGADFIRTHEPGQLRDALTVTAALEGRAEFDTQSG
jgi:dihydropteroate synthase type 2